MAPMWAVALRPPPPVPSPVHGRLPVSFPSPRHPHSLPPSPGDSTPSTGRRHSELYTPSDERTHPSPPTDRSAASPSPAARPAAPHPTEADWFRFPAPTREQVERGAPLTATTAPRVKARGAGTGGAAGRVKMLGEWRIGESLGRGTGGTVRLARSTTTGEYAAVKKVVRLPEGHKHAALVHREISLMKLVASHPHLVQLYDVFESSSHYFLVTEFCPVGELFEYVGKHRLSPFEVQKLFLELVSALTHLRRFRIAHRDIKPENLLLWRDEHSELSLKLADMGLATFQPEDSLLMTSCGSPHYAAPEVISNVPYDGTLADVWSAGVVLYAMFAGVLPFDDDSNAAVFAKIKRGEYDSTHPDVPPVARDLIARCLVVDPSERYTIEDVSRHPFLRPHPYSPGLLSLAALYPPSPARAPTPSPDDILDSTILASLKLVLRVQTFDQAERMVRTNELARHFYAVLLSFRQPRPEQLPPWDADESSLLPVSAFDDTSSENARSISAPELALFPLPPTTSGDALIVQREQLGTARAVVVQLHAADDEASSDDSHQSSGATSQASYESINRDYVFPSTLPPPPPSPAQSSSSHHLEVTTSAPPHIDSFAIRSTSSPPSPRLVPPDVSAHPGLSRTATGNSSGSGGSRSLPSTPAAVKIDPAFLAAARPSLDSTVTASDSVAQPGRGVRPRLSMQQRLRSLFQSGAQKRISVSSVAEEGAPARPVGSVLADRALVAPPRITPVARPAQQEQPHKLLKRQASAPAPPRPLMASSKTRPSSPAPSTRTTSSSMLKRSAAYPSLARALHGVPPLSPVLSPELSEFGDILALGASGPGSRGVRELEAAAQAREVARGRAEIRVYRDESHLTPRPSVQQNQQRQSSSKVPLSRDRVNEPSPSVRERLLGKASSSLLLARGKSQRRRSTALPTPPVSAPAQLPSTSVPTVTVDDRAVRDTSSSVELHIRKYATHSTSSSSKTTSASSGRWRRSSLSIRVPARSSAAPRRHTPTPAPALHQPKHAAPRPSVSISTVSSHALELEHELSLARAENRALRAALDDKTDEASLLSLRAARLLKQVDELWRERDELEKQLRRASWAASASSRRGGAGRGGNGGAGGSSIYSGDRVRESVWEGEWLGTPGRAFDDECDDEEDEGEGSLGCR